MHPDLHVKNFLLNGDTGDGIIQFSHAVIHTFESFITLLKFNGRLINICYIRCKKLIQIYAVNIYPSSF